MDLRLRAEAIPELGGGGKVIGKTLINAAAAVRIGRSIIDIGPWLGSTTAFLALGVMESSADVEIHSYDIWTIKDALYQKKAAKYNGLHFEVGRDILPDWRKNVRQFPVTIIPHKTDIVDADYVGRSIGLVVDDICNGKILFTAMLKTFLPYCIPRETVFILMDFYMYERKNLPKYKTVEGKRNHLEYQRDFMEINGKAFSPMEREGRTARFLYTAGSPIKWPKYKYSEYVEEIDSLDQEV